MLRGKLKLSRNGVIVLLSLFKRKKNSLVTISPNASAGGHGQDSAQLIYREDLVAVSEGSLGCSVPEIIKLGTWR